jgi:hypothetical protein
MAHWWSVSFPSWGRVCKPRQSYYIFHAMLNIFFQLKLFKIFFFIVDYRFFDSFKDVLKMQKMRQQF